MDIVTVTRCKLVSKQLYKHIHGYEMYTMDISALLSPFFFNDEEVSAFRYTQRSCSVWISGSLALQYFARKHWRESDLDLYVDATSVSPLVSFLQLIGYRLVYNTNGVEGPVSAANGVYSRRRRAAILTVLKFERHRPTRFTIDNAVSPSAKIDVIVGRRSKMEMIINFHSSQSLFPIKRNLILTYRL
jgi:hypothetical protein